LKDIENGDITVVVDERIRHKLCSDEYEKMIGELEKIYEDTRPDDI